VALGRNHADLPVPPVTTSPGAESTERPWPDPRSIRTVTGFFTALADVRVVSGLTHQAVSQRSAGHISAGTVGRLLNRSTLPATWGTAAAYLSACGVPDDQIARWQAVWQQLRAGWARQRKGVAADLLGLPPGTGLATRYGRG
jgi:hypothetical protein